MNNKIYTLDELNRLISQYKKHRQTIVLCHGVFDLLHIGHIKHLKKAKSLGDVLIVTVTPNRYVNKGPHRPVFDEELRMEALASLEFVDFVALNKLDTAENAIYLLKPDIYVKGKDYMNIDEDITGGINKEINAIKEIGGKIEFTDEITYSSSNLINNHIDIYEPETKEFLSKFKSIYDIKEIKDYIEYIKSFKVLVIGETIIDEYIYGISLGKVGKESIIAFNPQTDEKYAGGALAVANHISDFCKSVDVITMIGSYNRNKTFIRDNLNHNVTPMFYSKKDSPTVIKKRYIDLDNYSKVFETYHYKDSKLNNEESKILSEDIKKLINSYDVVVVCDFGHGMFTDEVIDSLKQAKHLVVNTQINAGNYGFNTINKYRYMRDLKIDFFCIDEKELRLATENRYDDIIDVIRKTDINQIIITRGSKGCIIKYGNDIIEIPALTSKIVDKVGAGDALLSISSILSCTLPPPEILGFVGNAVGALAVSYIGNKEYITKKKLYKYMESLLK